MIVVHVPTHDPDAARPVRAALDDLVVAYRVVDDADALIIEDGHRRIPESEVPGYLDELRRFVGEWRRFQSDACYLADDGSVC